VEAETCIKIIEDAIVQHGYNMEKRWQLEKLVKVGPCLDAKFFPKFYYAKRRFSVLNVDEIKN
jgi:hypothetical protein